MLPLSAVLILLPPGRGTPGIFPLWQTSGRASPSAPCSRCSDGAGAKAIPDARRADGAPQQARTSPRPQAGEGPRRRPTRHAADEVQPHQRDCFRVTAKRGVRGCMGCRGAAAPLPPCPTPGRRPAATRRPCRAAAASQRRTKLEHFQFEMLCISNAEKTRFFRSLLAGRRCAAASRFTFFKVETL